MLPCIHYHHILMLRLHPRLIHSIEEQAIYSDSYQTQDDPLRPLVIVPLMSLFVISEHSESYSHVGQAS